MDCHSNRGTINTIPVQYHPPWTTLWSVCECVLMCVLQRERIENWRMEKSDEKSTAISLTCERKTANWMIFWTAQRNIKSEIEKYVVLTTVAWLTANNHPAEDNAFGQSKQSLCQLDLTSLLADIQGWFGGFIENLNIGQGPPHPTWCPLFRYLLLKWAVGSGCLVEMCNPL